MVKRKTNTTAIKVKHLPNNDTLNITQLNSNKRVNSSAYRGAKVLDFICERLDECELIESYSNIVDNTQQNYYLINIDFKENSFENILNIFK